MKLYGFLTLVFDFDGTLATCPYDFAQMRRSVLQAAHVYGLTPEQLDGLGLLEMIEVGAELLAPDHARALNFRREAMERLSSLEYEAAAHTHLLPEIVPTLTRLQQSGFRLGIVTRNSSAAVALIIGSAPLPYDALLCREDVHQPKPHPDHVLHMLRLLDGTPEAALMVGDHPMDIAMGKAARMGTVAVLTGQTNEADLRAAEPDWLFPSVIEMAAMLLREA
ncbi:MAG: HAD family hydrolase [Armatimonadota bacterium]